jgi:ABC-type transport system involved in multi-copper enzyme maturation permease subunit
MSAARVTFGRVTLSEWTKIRSVRSTMWSLFAAIFFLVGLGVIACLIAENRYPNLDPGFNGFDRNMRGVNLAQFAVGVLGVLTITAEYSTGMIRSSMAAVPKRLPVLWAKALVFGAVVFSVSLPAILVAYLIGQSILTKHNLNVPLSHPGVLRSLVGAALFLTVMGLFGLGLGAIVRTTAGGISALVAIIFVIPPILEQVLSTSDANAINPYLPLSAGDTLWSLHQDAHTLSPWAGFAVFCAYAAVALAIGAVLLKRRDV